MDSVSFAHFSHEYFSACLYPFLIHSSLNFLFFNIKLIFSAKSSLLFGSKNNQASPATSTSVCVLLAITGVPTFIASITGIPKPS